MDLPRRCESCRYFQWQQGTDGGSCRVNPPTILGPTRGVWPYTDPTDVCGHHMEMIDGKRFWDDDCTWLIVGSRANDNKAKEPNSGKTS